MLVKFENFENKSSIVNLDNTKYLYWKHGKPNYANLDIFSHYFFPKFITKKQEEVDKKTEKILNKYKTIEISKLVKIYNSHVNFNPDQHPLLKTLDIYPLDSVDELDFKILYSLLSIIMNKPMSEVDGATSEEISKDLISISRRHIDKRLKKLEKLNLIERESYTLRSLQKKQKGHLIYNKFMFARASEIENPFLEKHNKWFPNDKLVSFLLNSSRLNIEALFSLQHLLRINLRRVPLIYKREAKKHVIYCFIKSDWLK